MPTRRGPELVYVDNQGRTYHVAREAVQDPVERDLCEVLVLRAHRLAEAASAEPEPVKDPFGFSAAAGPTSSEMTV